MRFLPLFLCTLQLVGAQMSPSENVSKQIAQVLPKAPCDIEERSNLAMKVLDEKLQELISIDPGKRTLDNTLIAWDQAWGAFEEMQQLCEVGTLVFAKELRDVSEKASVQLITFASSYLLDHPEFYSIFQNFKKEVQLEGKAAYYLDRVLEDLGRMGLGLSQEKRRALKKVQGEIAELEETFARNIRESTNHILIEPSELAGMEDDFIEAHTEQSGKVKLGCDYPTYHAVMKFCENESVRKGLFLAFNNRAYPANEKVLAKVIEKRDAMAKLLGFSSFTDYDIHNQMAKTPEKVESFLEAVMIKARVKAEKEALMMSQKLPKGISLDENGKLKPWDTSFIARCYKEEKFSIDEAKISEYFPLEQTMRSLMDIYETFFDLKITELKAEGLWHEEVRLMGLYRKESAQPVGYLLIDIFPREGKYTHACEATLISGHKPEFEIACSREEKPQDLFRPGTSVIVMNFPKGMGDKPALMTLNEVHTFFHEFGHALHDLLGAQPFMQTSGTRVKLDFVELPSQLLEEWLWDKEILQQVSSHYKTGEPLEEKVIDSLIEAKNFAGGMGLARQGLCTQFALDCFKEGADKDTKALMQSLKKKHLPYLATCFEDNFHTSFGHLMGYGSKYYSYLWSKVFALDVFEQIKAEGLLSRDVGVRYMQKVLEPGGGQDPNELLEDFLGRSPDEKAFFRALGLEDEEQEGEMEAQGSP